MAILRRHSKSGDKEVESIKSTNDLYKFCEKYHINTEPLDVEKICEKFGISIKKINIPDNHINGYLEKNLENKWIIFVNEKLGDTFFSKCVITHALCYYILYRQYAMSFEVLLPLSPKSESEKTVKIFADEILVPKIKLKRLIRNGITNVKEISKIFGVTPIFLRIRTIDIPEITHQTKSDQVFN